MKKSIIFAMVAIVAIACSLTSCVKNVEVSDEQNSVAYEESVLDEQEPVESDIECVYDTVYVVDTIYVQCTDTVIIYDESLPKVLCFPSEYTPSELSVREKIAVMWQAVRVFFGVTI